MLGPRPGREIDLDLRPLQASPKLTAASPKLVSPRTARSPKGSDVHPACLSRGRSGDWMPSALNAVRSSDPASAASWLSHASGARVILEPDTLGELVGPSAGGSTWDVITSTGAHRAVPPCAIRRVPAKRGDTVRVVVGDTRGFVGVVLSAENGLGVLRSTGEERKVRALPLDALCVLAQQVELS